MFRFQYLVGDYNLRKSYLIGEYIGHTYASLTCHVRFGYF